MHQELAFLILSGAVIALWVWATKGREMVDRVSIKICKDIGVQRLDESVALRKFTLERYAAGLGVRRIYSFEYSTTGSDRRYAEVSLLNAIPVWARLDHPDGALHIDLP